MVFGTIMEGSSPSGCTKETKNLNRFGLDCFLFEKARVTFVAFCFDGLDCLLSFLKTCHVEQGSETTAVETSQKPSISF